MSPPSPVPVAVPIPTQYIDPDRSGLAFDLTDPDQKYDIDLK
jgi:hypothetical protein